jgi:P-type Cu+ transporter
MATDPVCGMYVDERTSTLTATVRGRTYYFCSETCRETFVAPDREVRRLRRLALFSLTIGVPMALIAFGMSAGWWLANLAQATNLVFFVLATPVQFVAGRQFYRGTLDAMRNRSANMDVLIALGTTTAWGYSTLITFLPLLGIAIANPETYFDTAAVIIGLVLLGKYFEELARRRAGDAVRKLMDLAPTTARVIRDGREAEVPIDQVGVGDVFVIRPGDRVPVDGLILDGSSSLDESMITGESMPVDKGPGDTVIGATINKSGSFRAKATRVGADTTLNQIIRLVEDAQVARAPIQRLADRVASVFVPVVIAIAVLSALVWFVGFGKPIPFSLTVLIAVLIIACPCALGLATPAAIMVGTGKGAENGLLIKGGENLEMVDRLTTIVFDKTGTLTNGRPSVTDVLPAALSEADLLRVAASAERGSEHPIADAILRRAREKGVEPSEPKSFQALPGLGVLATVEGHEIAVGNRRLMERAAVSLAPIESTLRRLEAEAKTAILLAIDGRLGGVLAVADTLKDHAREAVRALKDMGMKVLMLTGDNRRTADAIATQLDLDGVIAEVLPNQKQERIKEYQAHGKVVAMVGDGINDAPALAQADVGIALGSGTDVAMEAGGIVLIRDDLRDVVAAIQLGRSTVRKIRQNLLWAFAYNTALIPLAAGLLYVGFGILLNPIYAGAAMGFSSVSVVANSMTLRRFTPRLPGSSNSTVQG